MWRSMLRMSWTQTNIYIWVSDKVKVNEGLLCFINLAGGLSAAIEKEDQTYQRRIKTTRQNGWIDNTKHWTDGGLEVARYIAWIHQRPN